MPDVSGRLVSMQVRLGSYVQRGDLIAEVDPSRPGAEYSLSNIHAPVSGRIVTNPIPVGSTVTTGTNLMNVAIANAIELEALIPEREVGQLRTGLRAEIRLEAFPGETFAATVTQLSPVVDPVSRTKSITMHFDRNDARVNPGMFARVKLNTRTYANVVSVPQDALVDHRGKTVVYVLNTSPEGEYADGLPADTPRVVMREVTTGVIINRETEIKSGLKAGESVVVQGQQFLTDGAPVRVLGRRI
jgi:RND family efflux transporter MFP subunit